MKSKGKNLDKSNYKDKEDITRRQAIQKLGYAAFASSTMLLLLNNPTKVHAQSTSDDDPGAADAGWSFDSTKSTDSNDDSYDEYDWD